MMNTETLALTMDAVAQIAERHGYLRSEDYERGWVRLGDLREAVMQIEHERVTVEVLRFNGTSMSLVGFNVWRYSDVEELLEDVEEALSQAARRATA